jgi:hypothetical protein
MRDLSRRLDHHRMDTTPIHRRLGFRRLAGPVLVAVGLALIGLGFGAESAQGPQAHTFGDGGSTGNAGIAWFAFGLLAAFVGAIWCIAVTIVALTELVRRDADRRRGLVTLAVNTAPFAVIGVAILLVWVTDAS